MEGQLTNDELERMWKKAVIAYFKVVSQNLSKETEENHKNSQERCCPSQDSG